MEGWNQAKFEETINDYALVSKRTHVEIVNTKAYYVSRKALWLTPKADAYGIKQTLGGIVTISRMNKKGKMIKQRRTQLVTSSRVDAPLVALIINARRGRAGEPGLYGKQMERSAREFLASRMSSIAFLKSCWLPAIRDLAPYVKDKGGAVPQDSTAKQKGRPKGEGIPAKEGEDPVAQIVNLASARHDHKNSLIRFGEPALVQALNEEEASMKDYMEKKMKPDADAFNAKQT